MYSSLPATREWYGYLNSKLFNGLQKRQPGLGIGIEGNQRKTDADTILNN
jgi:hypothetical protein